MVRRPDNIGHMMAIIITFFVFLITLLIYVVAAFGGTVLFPADLMSSYYAFHVLFDVAPWFQFVWFFIAVWQACWILYALATLCMRQKETDVASYCAAGCIPLTVFIMFSIALICGLANIASLAHEYLGMAFGFILLEAICLFLCLYIGSLSMVKHTPELMRTGRSKQVVILKAVVINGIGLYSGWADYRVFAFIGKLIVYYGRVDHTTAGGISLSLWTILYVAAFIVDVKVWDKLTRHLISPYVVTLAIAVGILTHFINYQEMVVMDYLNIGFVIVHSGVLIGKIWVAIAYDAKDKLAAASAQQYLEPADKRY